MSFIVGVRSGLAWVRSSSSFFVRRFAKPPMPTVTHSTLPATGIVLVGTRATCRHLAGQLSSLSHPAVPAGCVLLSPLDDSRTSSGVGGDGALATSFGILPPKLGTIDDFLMLHARYQFRFALVCLPEPTDDLAADLATADEAAVMRSRLESLFGQLDLPFRFVPTPDQLILGEPKPVATAPVEPHGLRRRPAVRPMLPEELDPVTLIGRRGVTIDSAKVGSVIAGKTVLITGAGGSIGSQLCQIVAGFGPSRLVMMERSENALFQIDGLLARRERKLVRRAVLHDVVQAEATRRIVQDIKPDIVFHAAAHKHVPLMEDHPGLALANNLFGTAAIADAAAAAGAERFVLISTDKAVNPSSAMGASKRLAELLIASRASAAGAGGNGGRGTLFSSVRFGNVLASAGSVVPLWLQQLADGTPITVTDPRMTRYFMTIPEAASLVVQAGTLHEDAGQSPIFVLDMGQPIRILDLACRFIRMHNAVPVLQRPHAAAGDGEHARRLEQLEAAVAELGGWHVLEASLGIGEDAVGPTVAIELTGARPGEKLHEQLAYAKEQLVATAHGKINRQAAVSPVDAGVADAMLRELAPLCRDNADKLEVVKAMMEWGGRG